MVLCDPAARAWFICFATQETGKKIVFLKKSREKFHIYLLWRKKSIKKYDKM
jgi:hypothetical protein